MSVIRADESPKLTLEEIAFRTQKNLLDLATIVARQEAELQRQAREMKDLHDLVAHLHKKFNEVAERLDDVERQTIGLAVGDA